LSLREIVIQGVDFVNLDDQFLHILDGDVERDGLVAAEDSSRVRRELDVVAFSEFLERGGW
jgi:hypothetical protein